MAGAAYGRQSGLDGTEINALLQRERDGLAAEEQAVVDQLRALQDLPPPLPKAALSAPPPGPANAAVGAPLGPPAGVAAVGTPIGSVAPLPESVPEQAVRGGLPLVLPTVGGIGGAAAGGFLGPAGAAAGESGGSMLGEWANQQLGITAPSDAQIAAAGAMPPALRAATGVGRAMVRGGAKHLPGAGPTLHEFAKETAETIPAIVRPAVDPETLWAPLRGQNPKMVTTNLANAVDELLSRKTPALKGTQNQAMIDRLATLKADLAKRGNDVPFRSLDATRKEIGLWTDSADETKRDVGKRLYAAIHDDLDANATLASQPGPVARQLKQALQASKDEHTAKDLAKIVEDSWSTQGDLTPRIRPGAIMDKIRKDPDLRKNITSEQMKEIEDIVHSIKGLPAGLPPRGTQFGSGPTVASGSVGAAVGAYFGGPGGAVVGSAIGTQAPQIIGRALQTDAGRAALRAAIKEGNGQLGAKALVTIANAIRGPSVEPGPVTLGVKIPRQ